MMPATKAFLKALRKKHHLGEFRTAKRKKVKVSRHKKVKSRKGVRHMARKRRHAKSRGGFGKKNMMMKGIFPLAGIMAGVIIGLGAASLNDKLPQVLPYQKYAAGFAVAGLPGVGGVLLRDFLSGQPILGGNAGTTSVY
jgi:hypothetical protein